MENHKDSSEDRTSRIHRYLNIEGEMTEEERSQFEQDLERDDALKVEYLLTRCLLDEAEETDYETEEDNEDPLVLRTEFGRQVFDELMACDWSKERPSSEAKSVHEGKSPIDDKEGFTRVERYLGIGGGMTMEERELFEAELETNEELRTSYWLTLVMGQLAEGPDPDEEEVKDPLTLRTEFGRQVYAELTSFMNKSTDDESKKIDEVSLEPTVGTNPQGGSSSNMITHRAAEANEPVAMRSSRTIFGPRFTYWLSGIAAVLVIGFFIGKSLWGGPEYQFEDWTPEDMAAIRGGADESIKILLKQADYAKALEEIEKEKNDLDQEKKSLESNLVRTEEDNDRLGQIIALQEQLAWLKGNALLGLDSAKAVVPLLEQMEKAGSSYYERMDSLYNVFK